MTNPGASILKVRRSILIKAAPARVWQAFASKAHMDQWWGLTFEMRRDGSAKMDGVPSVETARRGSTW